MISIARKNLFSEKIRFGISVLGVVFATFLILTLLAMYFGVRDQIGIYVAKTSADVWVMAEGTSNIFYGTSLLPDTMATTIKRKAGGGSVSRLLVSSTQLNTEFSGIQMTKRQREKLAKKEGSIRDLAIIVGFDTVSKVGGPWKLRSGTLELGRHDIVIDSTLADSKNINLGDTVEIQNEQFKVVGISEETNLLTLQMAFVRFDDAQRIFREENKSNYFLVNLDDKSKVNDVIDRVNTEIPNVEAKSREAFTASHVKLFDQSDALYFIPIMIIGFLVGSVVAGLTIYTATLERIREFGILKAIGASNKVLFKIVIEQSLWTVAAGFLGGLVIAWVVLSLVQKYAGMNIPLEVYSVTITFVASFFMGIAASLLPMRRVATVDPIIVFKG